MALLYYQKAPKNRCAKQLKYLSSSMETVAGNGYKKQNSLTETCFKPEDKFIYIYIQFERS